MIRTGHDGNNVHSVTEELHSLIPATFTQPYERCAKLPSGRWIVMAPTLSPRIYTSTGWVESPTLSKPTVDVSATTGMAYLTDGTVWQNSESLTGQQLFSESPDPLRTYHYVDASPQGWLLSSLTGVGSPVPLLGMPVHVEGVDASVTPAVVGAGDVGVDDLSATAKPGKGSQRALWVMAPIGGSTSFRFRSPATTDNFLKLSCDTATVSNDTANAADMQLTITGTGSDSQNSPLNLKLANVASSVRWPVMVKTMKKRTVKVAVHPIGYEDANGSVLSPTYLPTKVALKEYLDNVYGLQVNVNFEINYINQKNIRFDLDGDGKTDVSSPPEPDSEMAKICVDAVGPSSVANIDVWVVAGTTLYRVVGYTFDKGSQNPRSEIIIDGGLHGDPNLDKNLVILKVFAHEIGHVMIGLGHPDGGLDPVKIYGPARLEGAEKYHPMRLMYSSVSAESLPGHRIVKKEWDLIEAWLVSQEVKGYL